MSFSRLSIPGLLICLVATAICPAAERWRFIVTCDSRGTVLAGVNEAILSEIASEIVRQDADFLLYPGDLVYGGRIGPERFEEQLWTWVRIMKPVYDAGIPVYVCRGNHEVGDMWDAEPGELPDPNDNYSLRWLDVFGNPEHPNQILPDNGPADARYMSYSVRHKNALIVAVDQYGGSQHRLAHQVDQTWLDSQLQLNTKPHVFVFGHEPAFRLVHPDCLDDYPVRRDEFWRSLQATGTRMYFCGHDHFYDHAYVDDGDGNPENDMRQIVIATAGAPGYTWLPPYIGDNGPFLVTPIYHAEQYGYILVDIDGLHVTATWMERRDVARPGLDLYSPRHTWDYWVAPRPMGGRLAADLNDDGRVDFADLTILASQWLSVAESAAPQEK